MGKFWDRSIVIEFLEVGRLGTKLGVEEGEGGDEEAEWDTSLLVVI